MELRIMSTDVASWDEVQTVFGDRGMASRCQCQRYRLEPGESLDAVPADELCLRLHDQSHTEPPPGLLAFMNQEPVGWCAVAPRPSYSALLRNSNHTAWRGRHEQPEDTSVWVISCFWTRAGYRQQGIASSLAIAAVAHARRWGARTIEAYPRITAEAITVDLHVGTAQMFRAAGLIEVGRPSKCRCVMRLEYAEHSSAQAAGGT
ncbi:GNAT family N-acetyltransferase [Arthrobacter rhombi]|uniref:GNAT family N-acetyltransferase n=2 Tax=Arthrobacter rhombi TaxID=71253 RepID=UPI003FD2B0CA